MLDRFFRTTNSKPGALLASSFHPSFFLYYKAKKELYQSGKSGTLMITGGRRAPGMSESCDVHGELKMFLFS